MPHRDPPRGAVAIRRQLRHQIPPAIEMFRGRRDDFVRAAGLRTWRLGQWGSGATGAGATMRRSWRMVSLAVAAGLVGLVALNACGIPAEPPPTSQDQEQFIKSFLADRAFLFDGYATTVTSIRMPVDDTYRLTVRVCGEKAGCTAHFTGTASPGTSASASAPVSPGASPAASPTPVPSGTSSVTPDPSAHPTLLPGETRVRIGGLISTRLTSNMPGTVNRLSSEIQPVVTPADLATWQWDVTPSRVGEYRLQVHVSVLRAETSQPLIADQVIEIPLTVDRTVAKTAEQAWFGMKEVLTVLSAAGVSLVAVVGFVVRRFVKRRARADAKTPPNLA